jgi:signal transduction histidine kinase
MNMWRPVAVAAAVAVAGALGTLLVGAAQGMPKADLVHLALLLVPGVLVTVIAAAIAGRVLARSSFRQRLVSVAIVAVLVSLANLLVLTRLMFLSEHDATVVAVLLLYSVGAGIGAALVLARSSAAAVTRLSATARELADGNLNARVGLLSAGPELDALAHTLDDMAARLEASIARERAAETQRRDLITAVSHDLRTPLAGLRAMVEAIDDRVVEDPPNLRRYAAEMRRSVDSLVTLVDDLFELVQLDAGAIEAESERARLGDVVRSSLADCEVQAMEKGLVLEAKLNGADGAPCSPRLSRVLHNLLQNAIRHTPADGTVRVEARQDAAGLEVVVQDSGEGIPARSLDRVFEPFWRGDSARSGGGSGLGLALAKRIVEAMGGDIRVESAPTKGARFAVMLPHAG